ncbi:hypothetical protein OO185_04315 [Prosthecochloris sp. SCSIO W1102]|uniref:hypothetical protein n=1 Tax=Prosthecochloris sp. SCSIO W1102 TaxID=2992243 RepID=UPI00223CF01D|nr:hypothetical protein [Prosthecochloris sp. SCSIO W1102]UZJ39163.1 hypothetical protein OO185_04315 [Prosthecochloris sp. SCSIO W1102]
MMVFKVFLAAFGVWLKGVVVDFMFTVLERASSMPEYEMIEEAGQAPKHDSAIRRVKKAIKNSKLWEKLQEEKQQHMAS